MSDLYGFINNFSKRVMRRGRDKAAEPGASTVATESEVSGDPKRKQPKAKSSKLCLWITLGIILLVVVLGLAGFVVTVAITPATFANTPLLKHFAALFDKTKEHNDET
uniref:Transmembrane protein n=1 Tax=Globodera pallida TaxID=36090 RepID=A0A183BR19_GLOPA